MIIIAQDDNRKNVTIDLANIIGNRCMINETPNGTINGVNTAFTLANTPVAGSVQIFVLGLNAAITSVSGTTVTMAVAPAISATIKANYMY